MAAEYALRKVTIDRGRSVEDPLKEECKFVSKNDLALLLREVDKRAGDDPTHWVRWRALLYLAAFTGMRLGELRGLQWKHVEYNRGVIMVRQMADERNTIYPPKSRCGNRDIPLAKIVINVLSEWRLATEWKSEADFVFANGSGGLDNHGNVHGRFYSPLQRAALGEKKYNFHALRHTAASMFIEQGLNAKKLQMVVGHEDIGTTLNVYGHMLSPVEDDRELVDQAVAGIVALRDQE